MDKDKYMRIACELYNTGEITGEIYDAMILNADEFCDDDDDQFPPTYSEIEYDDMEDPEAILGSRWDDANFSHYIER